MLLKQRGAFAITTLILLAIRERPMTKTRLMQNLTLSYGRVQNYCSRLVLQGLIKYDSTDNAFSVTPEGLDVLSLSEELAGYITPVDKMIKKYDLTQYQMSKDGMKNNKSIV